MATEPLDVRNAYDEWQLSLKEMRAAAAVLVAHANLLNETKFDAAAAVWLVKRQAYEDAAGTGPDTDWQTLEL